MEREAIERLAIDSAAGQLNEDADTLLSTYLTEHPQANKWAEDVRQIYDKTEAAIKTKTELTSVGTVAPKIRLVSQVRWSSALRWAAVIALGITFGFTAGRWYQTDSLYRIVYQKSHQYPKQIETVSDLKKRYAGTFWGNKVLALIEHKPSQQYRVGSQDVSFWDRYRQYVKEK